VFPAVSGRIEGENHASVVVVVVVVVVGASVAG